MTPSTSTRFGIPALSATVIALLVCPHGVGSHAADFQTLALRAGAPATEGDQSSARRSADKFTRRRIADGDWFVDAGLGPDVPFAVAERLLVALRRGQYVKAIADEGPFGVPDQMTPPPGTWITRIGASRYSISWPTGVSTGYRVEAAVSADVITLLSAASYEQ